MGNHPAFFEGPRSEHNLLYTEMQACQLFGLDPDGYFQKSRESRMAMVAYVIGSEAIAAMRDYDMRPKSKGKK